MTLTIDIPDRTVAVLDREAQSKGRPLAEIAADLIITATIDTSTLAPAARASEALQDLLRQADELDISAANHATGQRADAYDDLIREKYQRQGFRF